MHAIPLEELPAAVGLMALIAYAILGGADFGGGIWDLLARGPRAEAHRGAISRAMGPVWEANHVWLIFLIVILFTAYPAAFGHLSIALFVPFHIVLVGIALRGAAFVFRAHGAHATAAGSEDKNGDGKDAGRRKVRSHSDTGPRPGSFALRWGRIFGVASVFTPVLLGSCLGAISSGRIRIEGNRVVSGYWDPWLAPFSLVVGVLALAVCAYLAAVYLTLETEGEVREDFRRRALAAGAVMALLAAATIVIAARDAPRFWRAMTGPRSAPILTGGALLALLSGWAVFARHYRLARVTAAGQVALLLLGWTLAQRPYLIYPDVTLGQAAAPAATLRFLLWTLVPGVLLVGPSLWFLFAVFKGKNPAALDQERTDAASAPPVPGT